MMSYRKIPFHTRSGLQRSTSHAMAPAASRRHLGCGTVSIAGQLCGVGTGAGFSPCIFGFLQSVFRDCYIRINHRRCMMLAIDSVVNTSVHRATSAVLPDLLHGSYCVIV
jgi:hypothetical protein